MQKIAVLNNIDHEHLRVSAKFSAELGDNVASTLTYVTEFSEVQKEYPILCRKNPETGEYQAVVFFGFQKNENLFLADVDLANQRYPGWRANYVPAVMARGPFSIGIQREVANGSESHNAVVHIDMNHPKIISGEGQALFLESGGQGAYLNYISSILDTINKGVHLTQLMFEVFSKHQLLEDVVLDIEFHGQNKLKIAGFETVSVEKLFGLNGEALEELNKSGFLQAAYFIAASMSNIQKLIDWKNRKLSAEEK